MFEPGTEIGRYEIQRRIGRGGMGAVYAARDPVLDRFVAIKVLSDTPESGARERLLREARSVAALHHPNIVSIHDYGEYGSQPYLVMEYVAGETILAIVKRDTGTVPMERKLRWMEELCEALSYAHGMGLVHLDIKPANLIVDKLGRLRILDFGLARLGATSADETTLLVGTPRYMAPEQLLKREVDHRADLWAFGTVLYELVTGAPAFPGDSIPDIVNAVFTRDPLPLTHFVPDVSADVARIVERALKKEPHERYADAAAALADVARARRAIELRDASLPPEPRPAAQPAPASTPRPVALPDADPSELEGSPTVVLTAPQLAAELAPSFEAPPAAAPVPVEGSSVPSVSAPPRPVVPGPPPAGLDQTMFFTPAVGGAGAAEEPPDAKLTLAKSVDGRHIGRTWRIADKTFVVGRSADCDLQIADEGCSARHFAIDFHDGSFFIRDLGSRNGTYVNGRRVKPSASEMVPFGASIVAGSSVLSFTYGRDTMLPPLEGIRVADRYTLKRLIRQSLRSAAYAAGDDRLGADVAIKLLSPELARFPGYSQQFAREALIAARLQHPHIGHVLDSGLTVVATPDGRMIRTHYLTYRLMPGGSLADRVDPPGPDVKRVADWLAAVTDALQYAHDEGVIHGDLKPTAVVFDATGRPYVTDFALGQRSLAGRGAPTTGSPPYMAPEQWDPDGEIVPATDQFALAALAYLMLTGAPPFHGQDVPEVREVNLRRGPLDAHVQAEQRGRSGVPEAVSAVLKRALALRPQDRYPSMREFGQAVVEALKRPHGAVRYEVFLSYQREGSGAWAKHFSDRLRDAHKLRVFLDTTGLDRAGRFPPRITKAIRESGVFVCFLAEGTLESGWVQQEIRAAHEHGKLMIPVFQEGFEIAEASDSEAAVEALISSQGVKLYDRSMEYIDEAIARLARLIADALESGRE